MQAKIGIHAESFFRLLAVAYISAVALLLNASFASSVQAACPNEAVRAEQGAAALALPDCRAYELASPGSTPSLSEGSTLDFGGGKAAPGGEALSYFSRYPAADSSTSSETWLTRRTADGWTVVSIDPQMTPSPTTYGVCQSGVALSEELDAYLLTAGGDIASSGGSDELGECGVPEEELVPGEPRGFSNLYLRDGATPYTLVNPVPGGVTPANATYQAASTDLSRVVFSEKAMLTSESDSDSRLFEWADGIVREIGVLPNGEHVAATVGAATEEWGQGGGGVLLGLAPVSHAVSADGERVFFQANGNLYLRENAGQPAAAGANCKPSEPGLACTLQLDVSKGAGANGGGFFQFASRDGDRVFFTSDHALTFPSSAQPGKPDLYEYDVSARKLVDLTVASGGAANVRGISGGSDDGSHVYFVARGVLTGSQQNGEGEAAQAGEPNIYLARDGALTYVATLSAWGPDEDGTFLGGIDRGNWWEPQVGFPGSGGLKTAWSPSGRYLVFSSFKSLTGFDNTPATPTACSASTCEELYLYDAEADSLACLSCDPDGAKPVADTRLTLRTEFLRFSTGPRYAPRVVLDSGQVFFHTRNPLSPRDENGFQDVYEYLDGDFSLISSGVAQGGSAFIDASADGRDVFFAAPDALVRSDVDNLPSIYDARVDGGFAEPPPPPPPCASEDGCRPGAPSAPGVSAATTAFVGPGNVRPRRCKRGFVRRGKKCVKKRAHRRHHGSRRNGGSK